MSILRFNRGGDFRFSTSGQMPINHALLGISGSLFPPSTYRVSPQIVYDVTTGIPFSKEELLTLPFFYEGTLERVPVEILQWTFAEEIDLNLTWEDLNFSHLLTAGYSYTQDSIAGLTRLPTEDYNRVRVYAVGDDFDTPSATFPQPSICMAAMRDKVTFDSNNIAEKAGTFLGGDVLSNLVQMASQINASAFLSDPGTNSGPLEVDTGIPLGEGTYMLEYSRITDESSKQLFFYLGIFGAYMQSLYLSNYGVWAAPVSIEATTRITNRETIINRDATFDALYGEHGETLEGIISGLIAEDSETITEAIPLGRSRFSFSSESVEETPTQEITLNTAAVTRQFVRFLPGQI